MAAWDGQTDRLQGRGPGVFEIQFIEVILSSIYISYSIPAGEREPSAP